MQGGRNKDAQKQKTRARVFFIAGYVLLCLMALLSSLGAAFVYLFSGAAFFLFFLAWQNWSFFAKHTASNSSFQQKSSVGTTLLEGLIKLFRRQPNVYASNPTMQRQQKITLIVVAFILSVVTGLLVVIFTSGSTDDDSEFAWKSRGDQYYNASQFDSAYAMYRTSIRKNDDFAEGYYGMASVKSELQEYDSAIYFYDRAVNLNPSFLEALYGRSWVYYNLKNYAKSIAGLNALIEQNQGYSNAFLLAGDNYYVQEKYDSAIAYYEPAYEQGVRSKELLNIMGYIYDKQGKIENAIALYQEALEYDSTLMDVHRRLGELIPGEDGHYHRMKAAGKEW